MVRGGGEKNGWLGKKNEIEELGKKNKKGKEKGRKKGEKGLKNASFWVINFKNFRGGSSDPPPPAPPCRILIRRKLHKKTGEKALKMHLFGS